MSADTGQLAFQTMGGEAVTVKKRGKHYVQPRGCADHPGTGPQGETCGSCKHRTGAHNSRRDYPKCALTRACHTSGRRTDILIRAAACSKWEPRA